MAFAIELGVMFGTDLSPTSRRDARIDSAFEQCPPESVCVVSYVAQERRKTKREQFARQSDK